MRFPKNNNTWALVLYTAASLLIFLPLLKPGYTLVLDMVFTPSLPLPTEMTNTYPFYLLLHLLDFVLPADLIQKLVLLIIFFLAGYGGYSLLRYVTTSLDPKKIVVVTSYIGGLLYMYNPFIYTRLMAGQYLVLIGYALLPFFVRQMLIFITKPSKRSAISVAALLTGIAITSIHTLILAILLASIIVGLHMLRVGRSTDKTTRVTLFRTLLKNGLIAVISILALNSFWIIPVLRGDSALTDTVANFTQNDLQAFATDPGERGVVANVLSLQGFWGDNENLYLLPQDLVSFWWLPILILWSLTLLGMVWSWRHQRYYASVFALTALAGIILSTGAVGSPFGLLNGWLYEYFTFFNGFREPQKFVAILALSYAYFAGTGLYWLVQNVKNVKGRSFVLVTAFLLPLACAPLLPWAASGQLRSVGYPDGWHKANQVLNNERLAGDKALALPWHLYMPLRFSSGTVANPTEQFFDIPVISNKDPELDGAAPYSHDDNHPRIDHALQQKDSNKLLNELQKQNIRYIILAKEFDHKEYDYLTKHPRLANILDNHDVRIYQVKTTKEGR